LAVGRVMGYSSTRRVALICVPPWPPFPCLSPSEDSDPPTATVWIPGRAANAAGVALTQARAAVIAAAHEVMSKDEFAQCGKDEPDKETMLRIPMPTKRELLDMLCDGDGQRFVACLVAQFDILARFVPVLDKLLLKHS